MFKKIIAASVAAVAFSGCMDDTLPIPDTSNQNKTQTAYFIDSAVSGIGYYTSDDTTVRYTDSNGRLEFNEGTTVTFVIGTIELPAITVSGNTITPYDLTGADAEADPDGGANDDAIAKAVNIGRLLQTLDADGDLNNGIQITPDVHAAAAAQTTISFENESELETALNDLIAELDLKAGDNVSTRAIVSSVEAKSHINDTILNAFSVPVIVPIPCASNGLEDCKNSVVDYVIVDPDVVLITNGDFTVEEISHTVFNYLVLESQVISSEAIKQIKRLNEDLADREHWIFHEDGSFGQYLGTEPTSIDFDNYTQIGAWTIVDGVLTASFHGIGRIEIQKVQGTTELTAPILYKLWYGNVNGTGEPDWQVLGDLIEVDMP